MTIKIVAPAQDFGIGSNGAGVEFSGCDLNKFSIGRGDRLPIVGIRVESVHAETVEVAGLCNCATVCRSGADLLEFGGDGGAALAENIGSPAVQFIGVADAAGVGTAP